MRIRTLAVAAAMSLTGLAAFAQDVKVDFDKSADFSAIKTFSVKLGTSWNNPIGEKRALDEISSTLVEKGWKVADANADAIVVVHGATQTKRSLNTFYSGGSRRASWRAITRSKTNSTPSVRADLSRQIPLVP